MSQNNQNNKALTIGSSSGLNALVKELQPRIAEILPKQLAPERFCKLLLTSALKNPDILGCTRASLIQTMVLSAECGLEISPQLGTAAIVPYWNGKLGCLEATFQPMYRGLQMLAQNHPDVLSLNAQLVYDKDEFDYGLGDKPFVIHKPYLDDDRGEIRLAYSVAWLKESPVPSIELMTKKQLEQVKQASQTGRNDSGPWKAWPDEMKRKAVTKRHVKRLPCATDPILGRAIDADNFSSGFTDALMADVTVPEAPALPQGAAKLEDEITRKKETEDDDKKTKSSKSNKSKKGDAKKSGEQQAGSQSSDDKPSESGGTPNGFLTKDQREKKVAAIKELENELGLEGKDLVDGREKAMDCIDFDAASGPNILKYEEALLQRYNELQNSKG